MRLEHLYGEESPEPTKRTDTPRKYKKDTETIDYANFFTKAIIFFLLQIVAGSILKSKEF